MVTTRRGDYITPEKNPPGPLECSPALRRPGDEEEEAEAEEGEAISSAAVDYAASLTFNDEQIYYKNNVAEGGNDDTGGDHDRGLNDDDGGDDRDDEGEQQQVEEEMGEAWERVTKKRKSQMSDDELRTYFDSHLGGVGDAPIRVATALQSLPIGTSVIPSSGTYVGSMRKRSMNKTRLFSSGLSIRHTSRKDPRLLGFASHLSMTACQSSLRQFACMCFALRDCSLFLTGDHVDGDRSGRRRP